MAYLPEPWTEMDDTEESCPLIQLTSSLVSAGDDEKIEKDAVKETFKHTQYITIYPNKHETKVAAFV